MAALVDTNVLVYCFDPRFPEKQRSAAELLRRGIEEDDLRLVRAIESIATVGVARLVRIGIEERRAGRQRRWCGRWMLPSQRLLDDILEHLKRLRARDKPVVDEEGRSTTYSGYYAPFQFLLNLVGCLFGLYAGSKGIGIEAQLSGVSLEQFGRVLLLAPLSYCLEEVLVHGPEGIGSLPGSTDRGFGSRPRIGVERIHRELKEDVLDFACDYVRFIQKRVRL